MYIAHITSDHRTQSVEDHLKNTATLAYQNCPIPTLKHIAALAALLHDIGKLGEPFQEYMNEVAKNSTAKRQVDHSTAGGWLVRKMFGNSILGDMISYVVYSHHGLQDCIEPVSGKNLYVKREQKDLEIQVVLDRLWNVIDKTELLKLAKKAWEDSQSLFSLNFPDNSGNKEYYYGMYARTLLSILMDSDWSDTAAFEERNALPQRMSPEEVQTIWIQATQNFESSYGEYTLKSMNLINCLRNDISSQCYTMSAHAEKRYRLTVPTGLGKTLSSLRFALHHAKGYGKQHIFYIAPYNSILTQNADEIRKAIQMDCVLEHHCNVTPEPEKEETYKYMMETWDSPIIATSAVQFLNALYSAEKSSIRRMYALCNSVIIVDEVQAIPTRCLQLFHLAMNFLSEYCNTTVVLCSATQPSLTSSNQNNLLPCKEMVPDLDPYKDVWGRVTYTNDTRKVPGGMHLEDLGSYIIEKYQKYQSVLVIVNTKQVAYDLYESLKEQIPNLYHLSTNMFNENIKDQLQKICFRCNIQEPIVCISTQLIEAGVDISFHSVIRSIAGLDDIIQAAGRCNRHKEYEKGHVFIVKLHPTVEYTGSLTEVRMAQRAMEDFLDLGNCMDSSDAIKKYYDLYFSKMGEDIVKYPAEHIYLTDLLSDNVTGQQQSFRLYQKKMRYSYPQSFRTAGKLFQVIPENNTIPVVVPYKQEAEDLLKVLQNSHSFFKKKDILRKLQKYTVSISEKKWNILKHAITVLPDNAVQILDPAYYEEDTGVQENLNCSGLFF